jgi:membrane protein DedA with SNARE-associated domain
MLRLSMTVSGFIFFLAGLFLGWQWLTRVFSFDSHGGVVFVNSLVLLAVGEGLLFMVLKKEQRVR